MTTLTSLARSLSQDGLFSVRDARTLLAQADAAADVGEVKQLLDDPGFTGLLSAGARRKLADFISAASRGAGALGAMPDGTQVFLKEGVFVSAPDAALPTTPVAYGETLYRAARLFAEPDQAPAAALTVADQQAIVDRIRVGLTQARPGRAVASGYAHEQQAAQQRSSSATVLREMLRALAGAEGQGRLLQDQILRTLLDLVQNESDPGLRDHMAFHLYTCKDALPLPEQRAKVDAAYATFAPTSPPYDDWFKDGNRQLNVVCHTGSEFFQSEVNRWKQDGFQVVEEGQGWNAPTILEQEVPGKDGEPLKIRLKMYSGQSGTFDAMSDEDTHIVAYSGHSGWGKNMPAELKRGPEAQGQKLVLIHQCCGQGIVNKFRDKYPETQLVTTRYSSYENEDFFAFRSVLQGIAGRKSWEAMHDQIAQGGYQNRRNNYLTPADELTRMKIRDRDHDGKADLLDRVYDFDTFDVPGDTATAFSSKVPAKRDEVLAGERLHHASQIVNTTLGFSDFLDHMERPNPFLSGGYFDVPEDAPDAEKMIRIVDVSVDASRLGLDAKRANLAHNQTPHFALQLNRRFAHASEEVVKAASFFEVGIRFGDGKNQTDKVLQSLLLVAHSLNIDEAFGRDQLVFEELRKSMGLPDFLTFADARRYLEADSHVYAGSDMSVRKWKEALGTEKLQRLAEQLTT